MSAMEKSDLPEVARKRANKAASAAAEPVERRGGAKENADLQNAVRRRPGKPFTGAGPHTRSRHQEQAEQADGASASHRHRCFASELLRSEEDRSAGRQRDDVDPNMQSTWRRTSWTCMLASTQGRIDAAVAPEVYTEGGRQTAAARHRRHQGQDCPGSGGCNSDADL